MNEEAVSQALNKIHDEAAQLLNRDDLPKDVEQGLERIIALARYKFPVTSEHKAETDDAQGRMKRR